MNLSTVVFPEQIIRAICRTLIYSLCWGVVAAALAAMLLLATRKMRSSVRYVLLVGIMGLFVLSILFTFYKQLPSSAAPFSATVLPVREAEGLSAPSPSTIVAGPMQLVDAFSLFCNQHSAIIVSIWFLIIALQYARMMIDLRKIHLMTRRQVFAPGDFWNERIVRLSAQLGIRVPIRLLQSQLVKMPVMLGHLKPIILVPIGILMAMPQDQVEAVLLHELAHIRRRDYLVNLLQRFVEIVFFFNPAVWWISSLIKEERENCCDDIVIAQTNNRGEYINALVAFQEVRLGSTLLPALGGTRGHLLMRVKRILYNTNKTMDGKEKALLIAGMAIAGFFFFSSLRVQDKAVAVVVKQSVLSPVLLDTVPVRHSKKKDPDRDTADAETLQIISELESGAKANKAIQEALQQTNAKKMHQLMKELQAKALRNLKELNRDSLLLTDNLQSSVNASLLDASNTILLLSKFQPSGESRLEQNIDPIIEDLLLYKVIDKSELGNFSFELNSNGLMVNNVRQPEELFTKFKEKYIKKPNDSFAYAVKHSTERTMSVSVH